ncbi:MAG: COR domain-containing protein [Chitinophagales bacterium]
MTHEQLLKQLFGEDTTFKQQANLQDLRGEHHPQSYVCNDAGEIIGLIARELEGLINIELEDAFYELQYLNLSDNPSLQTVQIKTSLPHLIHLDCSDSRLKKLSLATNFESLQTLDVSRNQLEKITFKGNFPKLELIDLSGNQLQQFTAPSGTTKLQHLYLNNNQFTSFHLQKPLPHLITLGLKNNQFTNVPLDFLKPFPSIESLHLYGNQLPPALQGNIESSEYKNNLAFIQRYFREMGGNPQQDNECKVLLLGNGNVGKTTFAERLIYNRFKEVRETTHAIDVKLDPYLFDGNQLNIWDFGGQDIYHATHRLFMQSNAIYLLFWDMVTEDKPQDERKEGGEIRCYDNHSKSYWLHYANLLGKESPVVLIQTKTEKKGHQFHYPQAEYDEFHHLFPYFDALDFKASIEDWNKNGLNKILASIKAAIEYTKGKAKIPEAYYKLRKAIRERQKNDEKYLSIEDYLKDVKKINSEVAAPIEDPMDVLENWLSKTGVVLFKKGLFHNRIILNQSEVIEAVYTLFKPGTEFYKDIQAKDGQFSGKDLEKAWKKEHPDRAEQDLLLSLMLTCELCFETTPEQKDRHFAEFENRTFITPQFLPTKKPERLEDIEAMLSEKNVQYHVRYQYPMLHYGLIQSFIVQSFILPDKSIAKENNLWRYGIYLRSDSQRAFVEAHLDDNSITVKVSEEGKPLLDAIQNLLEKLQDGKGTVSVSVDGKYFVDLEKVMNYPSEEGFIEAQNHPNQFIYIKDLQIFKNRDKELPFGRGEKSRMEEKIVPYMDLPDNITRHQIEYWIQHYPQKAYAILKQMLTEEQLEELGLSQKGQDESSDIHINIVEKIATDENLQKRTKTSEKPLKEKKRVLFICSSPKGKNSLDFGKELKILKTSLKSADNRDEFEEIKVETKVEFDNLIRLLRTHQPNYLHLMMHGSKRNGFYFEDEAGEEDAVSSEDFAATLKLYCRKYQIDYLLLSACNSHNHAVSALPYIQKGVVGTKDFISEYAANLYAEKLYELVFDGEDFDFAHETALRALGRKAKKEIQQNVSEDQRLYTSADQKLPTSEVITLLTNKNKQP